MLTDVTFDINMEVIGKAIIAITMFLVGLLILFLIYLFVKKHYKSEIIRDTINDKISYLYSLYESGKITENELKCALDKLLEEGKQDEKDS